MLTTFIFERWAPFLFSDQFLQFLQSRFQTDIIFERKSILVDGF